MINFLKECEEPQTRKQIADGIGITGIKVSLVIKQLIKYREIKFIELDCDEARKKVNYVLTHRTRFYFVEK